MYSCLCLYCSVFVALMWLSHRFDVFSVLALCFYSNFIVLFKLDIWPTLGGVLSFRDDVMQQLNPKGFSFLAYHILPCSLLYSLNMS